MNKIHSGILALVMSIFLIQAADPPYEKTTGSFLQFFPITVTSPRVLTPIQQVTLPPSLSQQYLTDYSGADLQKNQEDLQRFHDYLSRIHNETQNAETTTASAVDDKLGKPDALNEFLRKKGKEIHQEHDYVIGNLSASRRISKEDYVDELRVLSKEELDMLIHGSEVYQQNHYDNEEEDQRVTEDLDRNIMRRDDSTLEVNSDQEHIGEILPPNFKDDSNQPQISQHRHRFSPIQRHYHQVGYGPRLPSYRMRKSYEFDEPFTPLTSPSHTYTSENPDLPRRKPISFPGERFRPEYEPTGISSEGFDKVGFPSEKTNQHNRPEGFEPSGRNSEDSRPGYIRTPRPNFPPTEVTGFRLPRRFRGHREHAEGFQPTARDPYHDPSARYQTAWSSRRPRVIFPTDLVSFRDPLQNQNQEQEADWLAGDNNLQDIQEQDVRDR
ncbi:hypothetical protein NQ318_008641, partial [Aromia moschata]